MFSGVSSAVSITTPIVYTASTGGTSGCSAGGWLVTGGVMTTSMHNYVCNSPVWCINVGYAPGGIYSDLAWTKEAAACSVSLPVALDMHRAPGFSVLFLECSKNRTPVFGSILGTISVTSQIRDSLFYVHYRMIIFWYPRQYVPTVDCVAGTRYLSSWPQALHLLPANILGFSGEKKNIKFSLPPLPMKPCTS